jgi:hypothetical protein
MVECGLKKMWASRSTLNTISTCEKHFTISFIEVVKRICSKWAIYTNQKKVLGVSPIGLQ